MVELFNGASNFTFCSLADVAVLRPAVFSSPSFVNNLHAVFVVSNIIGLIQIPAVVLRAVVRRAIAPHKVTFSVLVIQADPVVRMCRRFTIYKVHFCFVSYTGKVSPIHQARYLGIIPDKGWKSWRRPERVTGIAETPPSTWTT